MNAHWNTNVAAMGRLLLHSKPSTTRGGIFLGWHVDVKLIVVDVVRISYCKFLARFTSNTNADRE